MNKKALLMVDSGCDLPSSYFKSNDIGLIPGQIISKNKTFLDLRDEQESVLKFQSGFFDLKYNLDTGFQNKKIIEIYILDFINEKIKIYPELSSLHIQHISGTRTVFANIMKLISEESTNPKSAFYQELQQIVNNKKFSIRVYDSEQIFSGQGVLALYTDDLLNKFKFSEVRNQINIVKPFIKTFVIPNSVSYIRERARRKGEKSIGFFKALIAKIFKIYPILCYSKGQSNLICSKKGKNNALFYLIENIIQKEFDSYEETIGKFINENYYGGNYLVISYGGSIEDLYSNYNKEIDKIKKICSKSNMKLIISISSLAAGVNLGPDTILISYISNIY